ncbi:putative choline transporter, neither null mutation nor overexpression affects choline transport [Podochytrium sp. JEL0797]|nr:putative choline transporter, neither null mutation nor overexpression affects choline transport [Podochytrium sp. JEL0797]
MQRPSTDASASARLLPPSYEAAVTSRPTKHPLPPGNPPEIAATRKANDLWAALLFFLTLAAFFVLVSVSANTSPDSPKAAKFSKEAAWSGIAFVVLAFANAASFSALYLILLMKIPRQIINLSYILPIVFLALWSLTFLLLGQVVAAAISAFMFALTAWVFWAIQARLALTAIVLTTASHIVQRFHGTILVSMMGGLLWFLFSIFMVSSYKQLADLSKENEIEGPIGVFSLFVYYWVSQLLLDIEHATVSGVVATFFFTGVQQSANTDASASSHDSLLRIVVPSQRVTTTSLYRTITSAFGTVCFSSLLSSAVQTLKAIARHNRDQQSRDQDANLLVVLLSACLLLIISCFGDLLDMFNKYVLTEVAIYGKP